MIPWLGQDSQLGSTWTPSRECRTAGGGGEYKLCGELGVNGFLWGELSDEGGIMTQGGIIT